MTQMTADQQTRYDDLVSRYVDLDDKEKAELDGLVKTVKEAKAKRKAAIEDIQKKLKAVEPAFTLKELFGDELQTILKAEGYVATSTARVGKAAKAAGGESGTRNVDKPIKSLDGSQKGVWLAHPPKFLEAEGCFTTFKQGKSVDAWLVDASDDDKKANFLRKLAKATGQQPNKTQLGKVSEELFSGKTSIKDDAAKQAAKADAKAAAAA
nr:hypothetical protein [Achromobacter ruhlandii]